jgi:hypothetical protein
MSQLPDDSAKIDASLKQGRNHEGLYSALYCLAVLVPISVWFLAVRAPLWLDETVSYWQIAGGFRQIWNRSLPVPSFPAYLYILWLTKTLFGSQELVLRIPSILAMLAAVYMFYRCARELFSQDVSLVATVLFAFHTEIVFAAIDVRPYAFAILMTNLAILAFLRWIKTNKLGYAALFGVASAGIFHFQYLFGCILAAFVVYYIATRWASLASDMRQIAVAFGCFLALMLPLAPQLMNMYRTRNTHVFADTPRFTDALSVLTPGEVLFVFAAAALVAALTRKLIIPSREMWRTFLFCFLLATVPTALLYAVSVTTALHLFIPRYLLIAVPGIALSWAWLVSLIDSRLVRLLFCLAFVSLNGFQAYTSPLARTHGYTWKHALEFADTSAASDHAVLLICSDLPESDSQPMPSGPVVESILFAPLSYYKVNAPIVPLPRSLNAEAQRQVAHFLPQAGTEHRRFLVLAYGYSVRTIDWIAYQAQYTFAPHILGQFGGVWVVEFVPRTQNN